MITRSNCCQASMHTVNGGEGTSYWVCTKCGKPCDPVAEEPPVTGNPVSDDKPKPCESGCFTSSQMHVLKKDGSAESICRGCGAVRPMKKTGAKRFSYDFEAKPKFLTPDQASDSKPECNHENSYYSDNVLVCRDCCSMSVNGVTLGLKQRLTPRSAGKIAQFFGFTREEAIELIDPDEKLWEPMTKAAIFKKGKWEPITPEEAAEKVSEFYGKKPETTEAQKQKWMEEGARKALEKALSSTQKDCLLRRDMINMLIERDYGFPVDDR